MARQEAEIIRDHAVDTLGGVGRYAHQFVGRARHELRIGAQEGDEFGQAALEPSLRLHCLHLGGDPRHFVEADAVDLLRRQVERRVFLDLLLIIGRAIRHGFGCQRGAGLRKIVFAEEAQEIGKGGRDLVVDNRAAFSSQPFALGGREAIGDLCEGGPERAGLGIVDDVGFE